MAVTVEIAPATVGFKVPPVIEMGRTMLLDAFERIIVPGTRLRHDIGAGCRSFGH
jgi:hypothetical protein